MRIITIVFFLIFTINLNAQEDKSVEVIVYDTLHVKAENYTYSLMIEPLVFEEQGFGGLKQPFIESSSEGISLEAFESLFTSGELAIKEREGVKVIVPKNPSELKVFYVKFGEKSKLEEFIKRIEKYDNVMGSVMTSQVSDVEASEAELIKRLISKAEKEAAQLAEASGYKLGEIISISEVHNINENAGVGTIDLNSTIGWGESPQSVLMKILHGKRTAEVKIEKALKVKFRMN